MSRVLVICAVTPSGAFGTSSTVSGLPWGDPLKDDMRMFASVTTNTYDARKQNAVIMGRVTWDLIPPPHRPLARRCNLVITSTPSAVPSDVQTAPSLSEALAQCRANPLIETIFVIGGTRLIEEALVLDECHGAICTWVTAPDFPLAERRLNAALFRRFRLAQRSADITDHRAIVYHFAVYDREDCPPVTPTLHLTTTMTSAAPVARLLVHEEYQYLNAVEAILREGTTKADRTGVGTLSRFGQMFRFSLADHTMPLLTTKRVFWKGIVEELFWMIAGKTSAKQLADRGVHIWDANGTRAFLDARGLTAYEEGDLGPVYGFQWRHFGAEYRGSRADYTGQGIDQLANILHTLQTNPNDRRMILTAWNPLDLHKMALPPCHMMAQFYVSRGRLSCALYQRSADMGLGVPFNIASYALLTHILAHCANLEAHEFVHILGDAHIYLSHTSGLRDQIGRVPRVFPKVYLPATQRGLDELRPEDVRLEGYSPYPAIHLPLAV